MKLTKTASGKKAGWKIDGEKYEYYVNLDERGEFYADVRDPDEQTVFEIHGFDIFEDGWMKHKNDIDGLKKYLEHLGIMGPKDNLVKGN